ncbi:MAG: hypothetical protein MI974_03865 [Chitinophagales bacterium]|nr:hypothetical protein [Chitinophagales bacterium]
MKQIKQLFREIIPVIIGILIALFINNWNDERKEKKYLDQMFSSIEKELEESILDIKTVIPKQLASVDTLDVYINNEEVSLYSIMMRGNGIHFPTIKTNSWNAIANSRIELIEYEQLSALADIEERKENLSIRIERQMEFIFQNFEKTDRAKKIILRMMTLDIVNAEKELQSQIEEFIKE